MRFMILIKGNKDTEAGVMPSTELLAAMGDFNEQLVDAGVMEAGEGLHPTSNGARVHFNGDERSASKGPFADGGLICGFWIFKVASLDEAIEWVKKCPSPMDGPTDIEIRQIFEAADFGEAFTPELQEQEERTRAKAAEQAG
jgi:hypothetical protein